MNPFKTPGKHKVDLAKIDIALRALDGNQGSLPGRLDLIKYRVKYSINRAKTDLIYLNDIRLIHRVLTEKYPEPYGKVLEIINQCEEFLKTDED